MKNYLLLIIAVVYYNISQAQLSLYLYPSSACAGGCNISGFAQASGGVSPYTYVWSNGDIGNAADSLCPGVYNVTVTDSIGNTAVNSISLSNNPSITASIITHNTWCTYNTGSIDVAINSGTPPFSAAWSNMDVTLHPTNLFAGTYNTTISDAVGCTITAFATISVEDLPVDIGLDHYVCSGTTDTLIVPAINYPPIAYLWNDGSLNSSLIVQPTNTNIYSVTVTDNNGCSGTDSILINVTTNCNIINGYVFHDLNHNGIKDSAETGFGNVIVQATPGQNYAATDVNGFYSIYSDVGNFSITVASLPSNFLTSTPSQNAVFVGSGEIDSLNNFGLYANIDTNLSVNLNVNCARPGFLHNENFTVQNHSNGTINITAKLIFDSNLILQSTNPPYDFINGDTIIWNINNLQQFSPCYFPYGIPYECEYTSFQGNFSAIFMVPPSVLIGDTLFSSVIVEPIIGDNYPTDNISYGYRIVSGSFDPNLIEVFPNGDITKTQVDSSQWMTYTIYFQNTGTDTCFTVLIRDTISNLLDMGTIQILGSSHPFLININESELSWTFPNILLPDSSESQINSIGFIKYRLKVMNNAMVGDLIENTANIYFDFNSPIITNTVQTNIVTVTKIENNKTEMLMVYPNPTSGNIFIATGINNGNINVTVTDIMGKVVYNSILTVNEGVGNFYLNINPGIYFVKVNECNSAKKTIKKLIIK